MSAPRRDPLSERLGALLLCMLAALAAYFLLRRGGGALLPALEYPALVERLRARLPEKLAWMLMNFAEPQFYAGLFSGAGVLLGGAAAYVRRGRPDFELCGGARMFPWVLASQLGSLALTLFAFGGLRAYLPPGIDWAPTFIPVVGAPPAVVLLCGPGLGPLLAGSVLGGLLCAPAAVWLAANVTAPLGLPGVVASVAAMAVTELVVCPVCAALFGTAEPQASPNAAAARRGLLWRVRRTLADFSEAQFYGNCTASALLLLGALLDWLLCARHGVYGTGLLPAVLLSQITGSAVGVFLYGERFGGDGFATFIPVVSVGPACVLLYGGGLLPALFAGVLGGVLGGPAAELLRRRLPPQVHPTAANVTAMALCTALTAIVMEHLPWFIRI